MTTSPGAQTAPLLHPRLAALDPRRQPARRHASRLGVLAGTLGACLTITFAAHAVHGRLPPAATQPATPSAIQSVGALARPAQVLVSAT